MASKIPEVTSMENITIKSDLFPVLLQAGILLDLRNIKLGEKIDIIRAWRAIPKF